MYSRHIFKGDDYTIGLLVGKLFKDEINKDIKEYYEMIQNEKYSLITDQIIKKLLQRLPRVLNEIYGRADGAQVDRRVMVLFYSPEVYTKIDACTTAIYKKKDRILFSHNEDDYGCSHLNRNLLKLDYGDYWLFGMGDYRKLNGSNFGCNSYGLVFSCNYLFHEKANLNNLSRYLIARDLIESKTIDECIEKLKMNKPASPFSFNVLDIKTNEVINIENDFDDLYITHIDGKFARSNHFLNKENPKKSLNSHYRNLYANQRIELLDENADIDDLVNVLAYEDEEYVKSIYMCPIKYKGIDNTTTIANFSFDSYTKRIRIKDCFDLSVIEFDYDNFESVL